MVLQSPFHRMLGTNYRPNDLEAEQIRDIYNEARGEIALLDAKMSCITDVLSGLRRQRDELNHFANQHKSLLSTIQCMPEDVWRHIFEFCLPSDMQRTNLIHPSQPLILPMEPVILSHVCGGWRKIVLAMSKLWSDFSLGIPSRMNNWSPAASGWIHTRLLRSGVQPLIIRLHSSRGKSVNQIPFKELFNTLIPLSRRWKKLHMDVPFMVLGALAGLCGDDVPLLEALSIDDSDPLSSGDLRKQSLAEELFFAKDAPKLHALSLHRASKHIQVPLEQLSTLALGHLSSDEVLTILSGCANLEKFGCDHVSGSAYRKVPIHLLKLRGLDVRNGGGVIGKHLFVPSLKTVMLSGKSTECSPSSLQVLISESCCFLESLTILAPGIPSQASLVDCLHVTKFLTKLVIRTPPTQPASGDRLLTCLLGRSKNDVVDYRCSKLRELELAVLQDAPPLEVIQQFLHGRCQSSRPAGVERLMRVELMFFNKIWVDTQETIRPYLDEGVHISITSFL